MGATDLTGAIQGYAGSGIAVARHLDGYGLVKIRSMPGVAGKRAYEIDLTRVGQQVVQALEPLLGVLGEAGPRSKAD